MNTAVKPTAGTTELSQLIWRFLPLYKRAALFSFVTSLLVLAPTIFMLEVYDRVVNSRSVGTLLMLTILVVFLIATMELLDWIRGQLMHEASERVDALLGKRIFDATFEAQLRNQPVGSQPLSELRQLRQFLAGPVPLAIADTPVALLYIVIIFLISTPLGAFALVAVLLMVLIGVYTERNTGPPLLEAQRAGVESQRYANASLKNAEVVHALGMWGRIRDRWLDRQKRLLHQQAVASDSAGNGSAMSKFVMMAASSLTLGLGALLTLEGKLDPMGSAMFLAWILSGKALQAPQTLISQWRQVVLFRDTLRRMQQFLAQVPADEPGMPLPPPRGALAVEALVAAAPGSQLPILRGVSFALQPGEALAVVGPGSGKSTLARVMVGAWPVRGGVVRLDGADLRTWDREALGPHIGYLPQDIELFDGTVAENIARFGEVDADRVIAAARRVGMHEHILKLPEGYDTQIGAGGSVLSGGQRQRIGLARALYGDPRLVVLDEPNSNLDEQGERALADTLRELSAAGVTVVLVTHRLSLVNVVQKVLVLIEGSIKAYGPRAEVMAAMQASAPGAAQPASGARAAVTLPPPNGALGSS